MKRVWWAFLVVVALAFARPARAGVRLDGAWPETDKNVSLDLDRLPRSEAVERLAQAAGWSIVVGSPPKDGGGHVDIHVKDQPPTKILTLLLADGSWVARRDGNLVFLQADDGKAEARDQAHAQAQAAAQGQAQVEAAQAQAEAARAQAQAAQAQAEAKVAQAQAQAAQTPPQPPPRRGEDRTVTGGHLKIARDEVVHDVSVFGGSVDVFGTVTGDLAVMGGRAEVHDGAHVYGSATTVGGSLRIRDGARVDGDVGVVGGSLQRGDKAQVGGSIVRGTTDDDDEDRAPQHGSHAEGAFSHMAKVVGQAFSHAAILFVFGTIVLALGSKRVETLRVEVASRPMRAFALGVVGLIAAIALVTALCVTIVGIPVAIVGVLTGAVAAYVGVAAVVTTLGEALLRHRTTNPYVHLALGCALLFVIGALPYVGTIAETFVAFAGIGVVVATRAAGLVPARSGGTYRV